MQIIYIVLSVVGLVLPYSQFLSFIVDNSLNLSLFFEQLFANQISSFFAFDVFVSSAVFWVFVFREGRRLQMKWLWIYIVLSLTIGLSFALPLFLGRLLPSEYALQSQNLSKELSSSNVAT